MVMGKVPNPRSVFAPMALPDQPKVCLIVFVCSPDILPMFAHPVPHMYAHSYHPDSEDFASGIFFDLLMTLLLELFS